MEVKEEQEEDGESNDSLEHIPKRAKVIFSVMANPTRIEILRILNARGASTYSELKSSVGFRSKRESGKFAYHLRKLLRYSLVTLNRSERKYVITNKGRSILNITKQIDEISISESGNVYVRTSDSLEEFKSYEIVHSLVREINIPQELAEKIAEEVENRIHKIHGTYITSRLIRDMVCSLLDSSIEYRSRFSTIGLPYYKLTNLLREDHASLYKHIVESVLRDYFLFNVIQKDVVDKHLNGDINISNVHTWGILPDTLFVNLKEVITDGLDDTLLPTHSIIDDMNDIYATTLAYISSLTRSAGDEVVINGIDMLSKINGEEFTKMLMLASYYDNSVNRVTLSVEHTDDIHTILDSYIYYVKHTPLPNIALSIPDTSVDMHIDKLIEAVLLGGQIAISSTVRSYKGIKHMYEYPMVLHNISLNLPRLAYETSKDETYFMTNLIILVKKVMDALNSRRMLLMDTLRSKRVQMRTLINMVGMDTVVKNIMNKDDDKLLSMVSKISAKVRDDSRSSGYEIGIGILETKDAESRFSRLDAEKYNLNYDYTSGIVIKTTDDTHYGVLKEICDILPDGSTVTLQLSDDDHNNIKSAILDTINVTKDFNIVNPNVSICRRCRAKYSSYTYSCPQCKGIIHKLADLMYNRQ